ncbi:hypothetical protein BY458DRAFT_553324 [Sporodiniella umbellata]|nr:hypothetical protein BY458DRAFT_553324 [Sporodiniella umbellata]
MKDSTYPLLYSPVRALDPFDVYYSPPASPLSPFQPTMLSQDSIVPSSVHKTSAHSMQSASCNNSPFRLQVDCVSDKEARTRVETQIKLKLRLVANDSRMEPTWSYLRIPTHLLAKTQSRRAQQKQRQAELCQDTHRLDLEAKVTCESDPQKTIQLCPGCVRRERKRAERKKNATLTSIHIQPGLQAVVDEAYAMDSQRILLLSCDPVVDFSSCQLLLPTRITCYCRHHNERIGFRVTFTMRDHRGAIVAQGQTPPIMITDDPKVAKPDRLVRRSRRHRPPSLYSESRTPSPTLQRPCEPDATLTSSPVVRLFRLYPSHGSFMGATQVTLLGEGFYSGMTVLWGSLAAIVLSVTPNCLVCLSPPADQMGSVPILLPHHVLADSLYFTYELNTPIDHPQRLNESGHTLLHLAAHLALDVAVSRQLLQKHPDWVHLQDPNGLSPLHFAIRAKATATIDLLLAHGSDLLLTSCLGTPIDIVIDLFHRLFPNTSLVPSLLHRYLPWLPFSFGK